MDGHVVAVLIEFVVGRSAFDLDIESGDVEAEATRLCGLGATVNTRHEDDGGHHVVMTDPEGNEFCIYPL